MIEKRNLAGPLVGGGKRVLEAAVTLPEFVTSTLPRLDSLTADPPPCASKDQFHGREWRAGNSRNRRNRKTWTSWRDPHAVPSCTKNESRYTGSFPHVFFTKFPNDSRRNLHQMSSRMYNICPGYSTVADGRPGLSTIAADFRRCPATFGGPSQFSKVRNQLITPDIRHSSSGIDWSKKNDNMYAVQSAQK